MANTLAQLWVAWLGAILSGLPQACACHRASARTHHVLSLEQVGALSRPHVSTGHGWLEMFCQWGYACIDSELGQRACCDDKLAKCLVLACRHEAFWQGFWLVLPTTRGTDYICCATFPAPVYARNVLSQCLVGHTQISKSLPS